MKNEMKNWKVSDGSRCVVQTQIYLRQMQQLLEEGRDVAIPVSGVSMTPYLQPNRDYVRISPSKNVQMVPGMIVFVLREDGSFALHRIIRCRADGVYLSGDAQSILEGPVERSRVLGWVSHVARDGEWHKLWRQTGLVYGVWWRWAFPLRRWWFACSRRCRLKKGNWDRKCKKV